MKEVIHYITAIALLLAGIVLAFLGFFTPPEGEIHDSVLWLFAQCLIYAGSVFGLQLYVRHKISEHLNLRYEDEDENETKTKAASKRGQSGACTDYAEREQARPKVKTKNENKNAQGNEANNPPPPSPSSPPLLLPYKPECGRGERAD